MKILIITRSFAPDSGIATIRPTKMAKYLSAYGHDVTVIRSGVIFGKAESDNLSGLDHVAIYSYEGENSPAEQFQNLKEDVSGTAAAVQDKHRSKRQNLRTVKKIAHIFLDPVSYYADQVISQKKIMALYNSTEEMRGFDIILSTFGPLGGVLAGRAIQKKEHCKWIVDYRDLMNNRVFSVILRSVNACVQRRFLKEADASLCVSEGNRAALAGLFHGKYSNKTHVIHNGYEKSGDLPENAHVDNSGFHICYTGTLHGGNRDCSPLFYAISQIEREPHLPIIIDYAGQDGAALLQQAAAFGLEDIVVDHGYLTRKDTMQLQARSDLFLVVSWNTKSDQGILTGKFYEALQHKKPVAALVSGNVPDSELKMLIDRYNLGVCYEEPNRATSEQRLKEFLLKQYNRKKNGLPLEYLPDPEVFSGFEYSGIVKQLESIMLEMTETK